MNLDAIDLGILRILHEDARTPIFDIAKKLRVSRPTVKARIDKMLRAGVIKRFAAIVDRDAICENTIVLIRLKAQDLESVLGELKKMEEVSEVYHTTGERNVVCKAIVQGRAEVKDVLVSISRLKVSDVESQLILSTAKEEYEMGIGPEIGVTLRCEYCGSTIAGTPRKFKIHNSEHYFCCPICLRNYRKKIELMSTAKPLD